MARLNHTERSPDCTAPPRQSHPCVRSPPLSYIRQQRNHLPLSLQPLASTARCCQISVPHVRMDHQGHFPSPNRITASGLRSTTRTNAPTPHTSAFHRLPFFRDVPKAPPEAPRRTWRAGLTAGAIHHQPDRERDHGHVRRPNSVESSRSFPLGHFFLLPPTASADVCR